ncbi:unnamed protein product [Mytilus coruscus]|uniref:Uncharacterized protein n=1 Tax=Mytilus coruscus TaxID=42192 RepID=A0A6J8ET52_MYTCO|nr:unnamed protein product [Mytilus coruscus]
MVQNSIPKNFFVALANSTPMTGTVGNQAAISNQQCISTIISPVTSQESLHSKESHLQPSAHQKNRFQNQHESQWKQFEGYANNPRLASVTDVLPSIIKSSKANSANNKYRIYFEKFRKWCVSFGLQYSPATSTTISLYIGGLIQQGIRVLVLDSNYYSIKWHHDKNFKYNPCSDEFLSLILEGGKRMLSKPINKKEPVTPEI